MKFQITLILAVFAIICSATNAERPKRGLLPAAAPLTAAYYAPASYIAAPNPIIARASRIVGAPGFTSRYVAAYTAPVATAAYTAPIAASAPYTVLYR